MKRHISVFLTIAILLSGTMVGCGGKESATLEEVREIYAKADERKEAILDSPTTIVKSDTYIMGETYTGTAYYISNKGNDYNDGLSEQTPFATLDAFQNIELQYGDAIFFERGSIWRAVELPRSVRGTKGITLSAYGEGPKPAFYGSEENGAGADKWELHYSDDSGRKIWKFYRDMTEVASIVLNGEEVVRRDVAWWDGTTYFFIDEADGQNVLTEQEYDVAIHLEDMWCFPAIQYPELTRETIFRSWDETLEKDVFYTGELFLRCDEGNPGECFGDIEFIGAYGFCDGMVDDLTFDNLCIQYSSSTFTSGYDGVKEANNGVVQNCELGWMGGNICAYSDADTEGDTRVSLNYGLYGRNGGGISINGSGYTIRNNYVHDVYQEGIALETFDGCESMCDNTVSGNLVKHATQGMLICNWDMEVNPEHIFKNIIVENNIVIDMGTNNYLSNNWETKHANAVLLQGGPCANENLVIRNNTFAFATGTLAMVENFSEEYSRVFEGNTYIQYAGANDENTATGISVNNKRYVLDSQNVVDYLGDETGIVKTTGIRYFVENLMSERSR